jgi:hypothetical protein
MTNITDNEMNKRFTLLFSIAVMMTLSGGTIRGQHTNYCECPKIAKLSPWNIAYGAAQSIVLHSYSNDDNGEMIIGANERLDQEYTVLRSATYSNSYSSAAEALTDMNRLTAPGNGCGFDWDGKYLTNKIFKNPEPSWYTTPTIVALDASEDEFDFGRVSFRKVIWHYRQHGFSRKIGRIDNPDKTQGYPSEAEAKKAAQDYVISSSGGPTEGLEVSDIFTSRYTDNVTHKRMYRWDYSIYRLVFWWFSNLIKGGEVRGVLAVLGGEHLISIRNLYSYGDQSETPYLLIPSNATFRLQLYGLGEGILIIQMPKEDMLSFNVKEYSPEIHVTGNSLLGMDRNYPRKERVYVYDGGTLQIGKGAQHSGTFYIRSGGTLANIEDDDLTLNEQMPFLEIYRDPQKTKAAVCNSTEGALRIHNDAQSINYSVQAPGVFWHNSSDPLWLDAKRSLNFNASANFQIERNSYLQLDAETGHIHTDWGFTYTGGTSNYRMRAWSDSSDFLVSGATKITTNDDCGTDSIFAGQDILFDGAVTVTQNRTGRNTMHAGRNFIVADGHAYTFNQNSQTANTGDVLVRAGATITMGGAVTVTGKDAAAATVEWRADKGNILTKDDVTFQNSTAAWYAGTDIEAGGNVTLASGSFAAVASGQIDFRRDLAYTGGQAPNTGTLREESATGYGLYLKTPADKGQPARTTFRAGARIRTGGRHSLIASPVVEAFGTLDLNTSAGADGERTGITIRTDSLICHDSLIIDGPRTVFAARSSLRRNTPVFNLGHHRITPQLADVTSISAVSVTFRNGASIPRLHTLVADQTTVSFREDAKIFTDTFRIRNYVELSSALELVSEPQMTSGARAGIYARHLHLEPASLLWLPKQTLNVTATSQFGGFGLLYGDVHVEAGGVIAPGYASLGTDGNLDEQYAGTLQVNNVQLDPDARLRFSVGSVGSAGNTGSVGGFDTFYPCINNQPYRPGEYADFLDAEALTLNDQVFIDIDIRPEGLNLSGDETLSLPLLHYGMTDRESLKHLTLSKAYLSSEDHPSIGGHRHLTLDIDETCQTVSLNILPSVESANASIDGTAIWSHKEILYIRAAKANTARIYSATGQLVRQVEVQPGTVTVPMPQGVYIILLQDGTRHKVVIK